MNDSRIIRVDLDSQGYQALNITDPENKSLQSLGSFLDWLGRGSHPNSTNYAKQWQYDAFLVENDVKTFGVISGSANNPFVYRGQNKDYPQINSSAHRKEYNAVEHCIAWIQKQEFMEILKVTPYIARAEEFRVLNHEFKYDFEAVAQHYEFISNYVDVTRNLLIALFFAYTHKDKDTDSYLPITKFHEYEPTLYIGNLAEINQQLQGSIKPISFEVLPRPTVQQAVAIEAKDKDIKPLFKSFKLPKSPALACEVFRLQKDGTNLFPPFDYMGTIAKKLKIKDENRLSLKFLKTYCDLNRIDIDEITQKLKSLENKYEICDDFKWEIPLGEIHRMDSLIDDTIKWVKAKVSTQPIPNPREENLG